MLYKRIICLVPSLTELLITFGLNSILIGRTKFCIHPIMETSKITVIGGTKNPNIEKILSLKPDLIIANKEENRKEDLEELSKYSKVIVTEIDTIDKAFHWIKNLGILLGVEAKANEIIDEVKSLLPFPNSYDSLRTAYFIWKDPWMTIGNDTYIHDVMKRFRLLNVYENQTRYPETNLEELVNISPDIILLSSEPFPFKEKHIGELKSSLPTSKILLVNGEWFSWYGSRMIPAFQELTNWRAKLAR